MYASCCEPYVAGWEVVPTAEALMRSRYSAYARAEVDYLVATHAPETRAPDLHAQVAAWAKAARFVRLEVVDRQDGGVDDASGTVTFVAHFVEGGVARAMSERSRFRKDASGWVYVDGSTAPIKTAAKAGRNDPCPCGSGRKYKQCCAR